MLTAGSGGMPNELQIAQFKAFTARHQPQERYQ